MKQHLKDSLLARPQRLTFLALGDAIARMIQWVEASDFVLLMQHRNQFASLTRQVDGFRYFANRGRQTFSDATHALAGKYPGIESSLMR